MLWFTLYGCRTETVKYFNNEQFEQDRYEKAIIAFQRANYTTQTRCVWESPFPRHLLIATVRSR